LAISLALTLALCDVPRLRPDDEAAVLIDEDDHVCNIVDQQHRSIGDAGSLRRVGEHPDGETEYMHAHGSVLLNWSCGG
jgi:hypothetical protein